MESRTDQPAPKPILVADGDPKSLRVLEVSLRNAGFEVHALRDGAVADAWLDDHVPALVIADTALAGVDGFELCRRLRQRGAQAQTPVLLIGEATADNRVEAVKAGAEQLLSKPVYVKEIIGRVSLLLRRQEREQIQTPAEGRARFAGDLADMSIVDLLQTIEASRRSGVIELTNKQKARAEIYFRQGAVVDAEVGRLSGREAMFRLFSWGEGTFQIDFKSIRRKDAVELPARALVIEGMERLDEWTRLVRDLPPLTTVFEVDYRLLADRLAEIPDEVNGILRLFDGIRTLIQVMDDCGLPDRDVLTIVGRLHGEGIIRDVRLRKETEPARGPDLDGWLTEAAGPFRSPMEVARDQADGSGVAGPPSSPSSSSSSYGGVETEELGAIPSNGSRVTATMGAGDEAADSSDEALEEQRDRFTDRLNIEGAPATPPEMEGFDAFARELVGAGDVSGQDAIPEARTRDTDVVIPFPALEGDKRETLPPGMMSPEIASEIGPGRATELGLGPLPMPMEMAVAPVEEPAEAVPANDQGSISQLSKRWMDAGDDLTHAEALDEMGLPPRFRGLMVVAATVAVVGGGLFGLQHFRGGKPHGEAASEAKAVAVAPPAESAKPAAEGHPEKVVAPAAATAAPAAAAAVVSAEHAPAAPAKAEHAPAAPVAAHAPAPAAPAHAPVPVPAAHAPAPAPAHAPAPPVAAKPAAKEPVAAAKPAPPPETRPSPAPAAATGSPTAVSAEFPRLLADCRRAFEKGRMRESTAACTLAKDANPDSGEALVLLAHSEFNRNHRKEALMWAELAIKADPRLADAYVIMGGVQQDSGKPREAKWAYKKYLELAPRGQYAADLRAIVDTL